MTTLLYIAEAILDSAAEEYRDVNLESLESVQQYAEGALECFISDSEAKKILDCCLNYIQNGNGADDYICMIERELSQEI